jgi:hypothetical protein
MARKKITEAQKFMKEEMHKFKAGKFHAGKIGPGKGPIIKKRKQAVAVALEVARKKGLKVSPQKKK